MVDEAFADAVQRLEIRLVSGLDGDGSDVGARGGLGNGGGVIAIILRPLPVSDDVLGGDEPDVVAECGELARPVLRTGAGLHGDGAGGKVGKEERDFVAMQSAA